MKEILFTQQTIPTANMPRQIRHALQKAIHAQVPEDIVDNILLCLSELLTNLNEHPILKATQVSIQFHGENDGWYLTINDDGLQWDPSAHIEDDLLTEFSDIEHGRGIALVHALSDNISYQSVTKNKQLQNQVVLFWQRPTTRKNHSILIVEDNSSLRLLYQAYLADDYQVFTAENGYQALQLIEKYSIDLILSDIRMPLMNGLTLRKKMNQQAGKELIPFAYITAQQDELVQLQASELGIDDYLIKPVHKTQLLRVIKRILGRANQVYQHLTNRVDKQIVNALQPNIPQSSHGWRMHVATRNTGAGGGDMLLHHQLKDKTQLLLTDIMGHDDSAKFFSHAYGGFLHGLMKSMPEQALPEQLLNELSQCALNDALLSKITLTCSALQLSKQGKINIASAGHPSPLLITGDQIQELQVSGTLPGLIDNIHYQSNEFTLAPGQRIALFTDGLFESADDNETRDALKTHILDALLATLNVPIEQALQQVMGVFDQFTQARPTDDTLLLLLEPAT